MRWALKYFAVAAVAAGLMIAGGANATTNLLTNGSFETGDFTGWTTVSSGSGTGYSPTIVMATDGVARSYPFGAYSEGVGPDNAVGPISDASAYAAYFSSDVGFESLSQTVNLASGKYEVGFDAYVPHNGYGNPLDATFAPVVGTYNWPSILLKGTAIGPGSWKHYSSTVTLPVLQNNAPTTFTFQANGYPAVDVLIDRVYVIRTGGVPEPATWGLMIMGFGGIGAMLRSQRRRLFTAV
jgi:hypothetical protein